MSQHVLKYDMTKQIIFLTTKTKASNAHSSYQKGCNKENCSEEGCGEENCSEEGCCEENCSEESCCEKGPREETCRQETREACCEKGPREEKISGEETGEVKLQEQLCCQEAREEDEAHYLRTPVSYQLILRNK